ncbi:MAG TPA: 2-phospho-L-lactate transferase [Acidimicrobiales bacterium]|nr:2-phospho-L-lactate transferase [Acidimicrobiales bacterium]
MITVLAGGVGAARFLRGVLDVMPAADVTAIVNVGDDLVLHGLHISPDLDTVTYTLAGAINPETGWGLAGETWQAMGTLAQYGGHSWFRLGDRDLGTHLYRTQRLAEGAPLSTVTAEIVAAWSLGLRVLPATDDPLRTMVSVEGEGEIGFQDYFVGRQHSVPVTGVRFEGDAVARPAPGVLNSIADADVVVIAPSNPIVSIAPVLAVPGIRDAVVARRSRTVAISPIVAGAALKGPADRMLRELGHEPSVAGVARLYTELASVLVVDEADVGLSAAVAATGMECVVVPTVMSSPAVAAALARVALRSVAR